MWILNRAKRCGMLHAASLHTVTPQREERVRVPLDQWRSLAWDRRLALWRGGIEDARYEGANVWGGCHVFWRIKLFWKQILAWR
jgi:hypothetical protein